MPKKTQRLSSGTHRARTEEKIKIITELRRKYPLEKLLRFLTGFQADIFALIA